MKTLITLSILLLATMAFGQSYIPPIGSPEFQAQQERDDISDSLFRMEMRQQREDAAEQYKEMQRQSDPNYLWNQIQEQTDRMLKPRP